ncbi:MAG TPA: SpoIID/LytB domain-containing protein [Candidatus Elarobacter sp.]|jgi:stage II sporulation protein D|nr:SpoIID/LytB domain-containing protein [Candidatus Elarobacter sp.]
MIDRALFLKSVAAGATTIATGGLDVWDPLSPQIRVLVANDTRGETPQVAADGTFAYGGKRWRGAPSTVGSGDGKMMLVTTIDVDAYLQGVVPLESPPSWPAAALEAQAIVARTFALARRTLSRPYDVRADESDQRWGGVEAEHSAATAAIRATRGRTLVYGAGPASVFYSSCCGGHTADIVSVWNGAPLPYLRGVEDPHCIQAPEYRWSRTVDLSRAVAAFGSRTGGTLVGTALSEPDPTGRPRAVALLGTIVATVPVADFRRALGYDVVRSLWLRSVRIEPAQAVLRLVIEGSGRGHGVGLCQWGAKFFASAGASAAEILAFYFPGTSVTNG